MSNLTVAELVRRAKACDHCGNEHKPRRATGHPTMVTWGDPDDGHAYCRASSGFGLVANWIEQQLTER